MLFALPCYQFHYTVVNRCFYLTYIRIPYYTKFTTLECHQHASALLPLQPCSWSYRHCYWIPKAGESIPSFRKSKLFGIMSACESWVRCRATTLQTREMRGWLWRMHFRVVSEQFSSPLNYVCTCTRTLQTTVFGINRVVAYWQPSILRSSFPAIYSTVHWDHVQLGWPPLVSQHSAPEFGKFLKPY
jgi:hypothetical protein